jgi:serine/threonine protein kinase
MRAGLRHAAGRAPLSVGHTVQLGGSIGRVFVERLLRQGAFGTVYAVQAHRFGGPHVLKCVPLQLQSQASVAREVALQRRAAGRYIVTVGPATYTPTHAFFLMERGATGTVEDSVAQALARGAPHDLAVLLRWFGHMVQAVAHCHSRGIVHRDIKPENFVLVGDPTPERAQAKLTDFGLAAWTTDRPHSVGTITYMAPELLREAGNGLAADAWSLGTTLFRLIAGIEPFYDETAEAIALRLLQGRPQFTLDDLEAILRLRGAAPLTRQAVRQAVEGLLQPNAHRRMTLPSLQASLLLRLVTP